MLLPSYWFFACVAANGKEHQNAKWTIKENPSVWETTFFTKNRFKKPKSCCLRIVNWSNERYLSVCYITVLGRLGTQRIVAHRSLRIASEPFTPIVHTNDRIVTNVLGVERKLQHCEEILINWNWMKLCMKTENWICVRNNSRSNESLKSQQRRNHECGTVKRKTFPICNWLKPGC